MPRRYKEICPSLALLDSEAIRSLSASEPMSEQYFQAEPDSTPEDVFVEHHILLNLQDKPHRVQNTRDGELRDFIFRRNDIIVTPAGIRSGWRWFARSDVIVVTMEPAPVGRFAEMEMDLFLTDRQLADTPIFSDADIVQAGVMLRDTIDEGEITSAVMFEAMSRVILTKLLQRYADRRPEDVGLSAKFTSQHYQRILRHIRVNLDRTIALDDLAGEAGMSPSHFSRVFKEVVGKTPMQYVTAYRIEQAVKLILEDKIPLSQIADACGFADQAHFSRTFKKLMGSTPLASRASSKAKQ